MFRSSESQRAAVLKISSFFISEVRFRFCASGTEHLILVDRAGVAWSWGRGPQTGRIKLGAGEEDEGSDSKVTFTRIDFFQVCISEQQLFESL